MGTSRIDLRFLGAIFAGPTLDAVSSFLLAQLLSDDEVASSALAAAVDNIFESSLKVPGSGVICT